MVSDLHLNQSSYRWRLPGAAFLESRFIARYRNDIVFRYAVRQIMIIRNRHAKVVVYRPREMYRVSSM